MIFWHYVAFIKIKKFGISTVGLWYFFAWHTFPPFNWTEAHDFKTFFVFSERTPLALYRISELSTVIMRDCGLASNLLATVNSAFYAPRFPIKTIFAAVKYLGVDKVFLLALGLGLFRHIMATMRKQKLLKLYAISYFSGILAMSLAEKVKHANPEEIFIVGLFYRLPGMSLANTFPERFHKMEALVNEKGMTINQACAKVFQVKYHDYCDAVLELYNLPQDVKSIIGQRSEKVDPLISLVKESADLAAMLFGERAGGRTAIQASEDKISKILGVSEFSVPKLVRSAFENDINVKNFFNLSAEDVEMMVNLLEWGKAIPMEVVSHLDFGASLNPTEPADSPETLIGHFLTELLLCRKRNSDLNQVLILAQEALFRCLPDSEIFIAFLSVEKQKVQGRSYIGSALNISAQDFAVSMSQSDSVIIQCIKSMSSVNWHSGDPSLGLPYNPFGTMVFQQAYLSPIVVRNRGIGLCFAGRYNAVEYNERECIWADQIAEQIASAFNTLQT